MFKKKILWMCCFLFLLFFMATASASTISTSDGWNLKSSGITITVSESLADDTKFVSVWKWESGNNSWAVYLPGEPTAGEYATSKGFAPLTTISPGEGFWVNSKGSQSISVTGTEVSSTDLTLNSGWNLKGLTTDSSITAGAIFSDDTKFASVWKWETDKWTVYLPSEETQGTYANSKGFAVLTTISPGEGFWVNAKGSETVNISGVETPPLVGKVSEVVGKNDKNSYKAVPGAVVSINNVLTGKTDSQGKFETTDYSGSSVTVNVELPGYVPFNEIMTIPESNQIYIFIQKQDTNPEELEATQSFSRAISGPWKPTPKVITSSDNTTSIQITNMQLTKDITLAVTPYKSLNTIPDIDAIADLNLGTVDVVGGADVSVVDSEGNPITSKEAGFSAQVILKTTKVLGKWDLDKIQTKTGSGGSGKLYLLSRTPQGWKTVGQARVEQKENSSVKNMLPDNGVTMTSLNSFLFVLATTEEVKENQISGKVVKAGTEEGIPGVYVGADGFFTEAVTDASGNFTLDLHIMDATALNLQFLFLYAWKDGYYAGSKEIPIDAQASDLAGIKVEMEPFGEITSISGYVHDTSENPIPDALVTLKTPSVLDEIYFEENKAYVGKSDEAIYKWDIMDEPTEFSGEPAVLKTIQAKGKNSLSIDDVKSLLEGITGEKVFLISLEVTHKVGENQFKEQAMGMAFVYEFAGEQTIEFDLMPDFTNFSIMEAWTDSQGAYQFYDVEKKLVPFLKAAAKASGYKPTSYVTLETVQEGAITKDFTLEVQTVAKSYEENFETGTADIWSTKIESGGQALTSNTKWQLLNNPDQVVMPSNLLNSVMFADMGWVDAQGTIGTIIKVAEQSDEFFVVGKAVVTFLENGQEKTINTLLYDFDGQEGIPDGKYEFIELDDTQEQGNYDLWYDFGPETTEYWSMNLVEGSTIMVSYQGVSDGEGEGLSLLPAYSESHVFWVGNLNSSDYIGTYYDPDLNTGEDIVDAYLESPMIDLNDFSYVTLQLQTWFEVNGINYSSMVLEVALMDDDLAEGDSVTIESDYGEVSVKKGEFVPLFQFNPFAMMGMGAFDPSGAGESEFSKTAIPKKGLLQEVETDADSDGMPDEPAIGLSSAGEFAPPLWTPFEYNLNPYAGHKIKLRFKFSFINKSSNLFRGWAIDDVKILDVESYSDFEIMTPEFGFFSDYYIEEIIEGESWSGSYAMKLTDGISLDMEDPSAAEPAPYTQADQYITIIQEALWVETNFNFAGLDCTVEGNFLDESYNYLDFYFYDTNTDGETLWGWGVLFVDEYTGVISGSIGAETSNGIMYGGELIVETTK